MSSASALPVGAVDPADQLAFEELNNRYTVGIDTKDSTLFRSAFTEDCFMSFGDMVGPFEGIDALDSFISYFHAPLDALQHSATGVLVTEISEDRASVRSSINAVLVRNDAEDGPTFRLIGTYEDEVVRTPQGWRIARRAFMPVWVEGNANVGAWDWPGLEA